MALYGHFLAVTGRRKAAQEQLDRASACPEPPGLAGSFYIPFLVEGYVHLGVNERAAAYIERIRSMRGFMYYGNSVDRVLGVIATLAGDWEPEQRFRQIECTRACCRCGLCYQARYSLISPTCCGSRANQRVKARD